MTSSRKPPNRPAAPRAAARTRTHARTRPAVGEGRTRTAFAPCPRRERAPAVPGPGGGPARSEGMPVPPKAKRECPPGAAPQRRRAHSAGCQRGRRPPCGLPFAQAWESGSGAAGCARGAPEAAGRQSPARARPSAAAAGAGGAGNLSAPGTARGARSHEVTKKHVRCHSLLRLRLLKRAPAQRGNSPAVRGECLDELIFSLQTCRARGISQSSEKLIKPTLEV